MDRTLRCIEQAAPNVSGFCLWNYTPDNSRAIEGDGWNREDFSFFCQDDVVDEKNIFSGCRSLPAIIRPAPFKIPGILMGMQFDGLYSRKFEMKFVENIECTSTECIVFVPRYQYGANRWKATITAGSFADSPFDEKTQTLRYKIDPTEERIHTLTIEYLGIHYDGTIQLEVLTNKKNTSHLPPGVH